LKAAQLCGIAEVYGGDAGQAITQNRTSEVRKLEVRRDGFPTTLYVKKYWAPTWGHVWRGVFRGTFFGTSKVRREYDNLQRLRSLGLDAPEPVACGEERCFGFLVRSYLISAGIPDPMPLDWYIGRFLKEMSRPDQSRVRHELIERLARHTRSMHGHGFVHYDYFWRNILLSGGKLDHFYLIDAHKGCLRSSRRIETLRIVDLAALDAPAPAFLRRSERLRFFLCYRDHRRLTRQDRRLIRRILDYARPLRGRQLERVRQAAEST